MHNLSLILRKTWDTPGLRNILQDTWPVFLKTVKAMKSNETLRNWYGPEETEEVTKGNTVSTLDWILEHKKTPMQNPNIVYTVLNS